MDESRRVRQRNISLVEIYRMYTHQSFDNYRYIAIEKYVS